MKENGNGANKTLEEIRKKCAISYTSQTSKLKNRRS